MIDVMVDVMLVVMIDVTVNGGRDDSGRKLNGRCEQKLTDWREGGENFQGTGYQLLGSCSGRDDHLGWLWKLWKLC